MPTDTPSTQNTTDDKGTQQGATSSQPDQKASDQKAQDQKAQDAVVREEHLKALEKARTEEKNKLYPELQRLKGEREEKEKELSKFKAEAEELRNKLKLTQDSTMTEQQKLEKRLSDLEERTRKAEAEKSEITANAERKVADLELRLYRERKIREAGIELVELVTGSTPGEIDAAVERAREREAELLGKAKERLRNDVAKELGRTLPGTGAAPSSDAGTKDRIQSLSPRQRSELAKIRDPQKYREARARMLAEAVKQLPEDHPWRSGS